MAAKQITQQTFDDVVKENIADFEMSPQEAIDDAVQQFESQGVNLAFIVKDPILYSTGADDEGTEHPLIAALRSLSLCLGDKFEADAEMSQHLTKLKEECDIDLAHRCLAGNHKAYSTLLKVVQAFKNHPSSLQLVLTSFSSLVNGQPDLLDSEGTELLIDLLTQYKNDPVTLEFVVRAIRLNCIKHESNRQNFVHLKLITLLTELLVQHKSHPTLTKEICMNLRALTLDDDVRVPFGKAHDNAKAIVTEGDALEAILELCKEFVDNTSVLAELFLTLSCLAVRNEFCQEVMDRGGLGLIIKAFHSGLSDKVIVRHALIVLKVLAGNDEVKKEITKLGGVELVVAAMMTHETNTAIADASCRVLTAITLRNTENCGKVIECQGHQHIVQAMKLHPDDVGVQKQACMALRNLVARTKDNTECILRLDTERLLNTAMNKHKDAHDEAKAALRDLGCKVELTELWKGQRGTIQ